MKEYIDNNPKIANSSDIDIKNKKRSIIEDKIAKGKEKFYKISGISEDANIESNEKIYLFCLLLDENSKDASETISLKNNNVKSNESYVGINGLYFEDRINHFSPEFQLSVHRAAIEDVMKKSSNAEEFRSKLLEYSNQWEKIFRSEWRKNNDRQIDARRRIICEEKIASIKENDRTQRDKQLVELSGGLFTQDDSDALNELRKEIDRYNIGHTDIIKDIEKRMKGSIARKTPGNLEKKGFSGYRIGELKTIYNNLDKDAQKNEKVKECVEVLGEYIKKIEEKNNLVNRRTEAARVVREKYNTPYEYEKDRKLEETIIEYKEDFKKQTEQIKDDIASQVVAKIKGEAAAQWLNNDDCGEVYFLPTGIIGVTKEGKWLQRGMDISKIKLEPELWRYWQKSWNAIPSGVFSGHEKAVRDAINDKIKYDSLILPEDSICARLEDLTERYHFRPDENNFINLNGQINPGATSRDIETIEKVLPIYNGFISFVNFEQPAAINVNSIKQQARKYARGILNNYPETELFAGKNGDVVLRVKALSQLMDNGKNDFLGQTFPTCLALKIYDGLPEEKRDNFIELMGDKNNITIDNLYVVSGRMEYDSRKRKEIATRILFSQEFKNYLSKGALPEINGFFDNLKR